MHRSRTSFWKSLSSGEKYMVGNLFFLYFVQGIFVIGIGSLLPMMKAEYGLSYEVGGALISAHNIGSLITGMFVGMLPALLGYKRTLLYFNVLPFLGFAITLVTGNPILLFLAILLTGIGRGAVNYYNNQIINFLSHGSSGPLNMLHSFFAIGALLSPFLVLACTSSGDSGWRTAVYIIIGMGVVSMLTSPRMQMDSVSPEGGQAVQPAQPFGFWRERRFWLTAAIMLCYLSIEASVMGWLVTYFIDSGAASASSAQMLTALLWVVILLGRTGCILIAGHVSPPTFLRCASLGIAVFLVVVIASPSFVPLLLGTIGLGLCMAGMYGTTVSNATEVFKTYPLAMGFFVTLTGIGSVIAPSVIGAVAGQFGMRVGLGVLLVPAVLLILFAFVNRKA